MPEPTITVEAVRTDRLSVDLADFVWAFALDQRAFGPRRLVTAFADEDGRLRSLAHAPRTDPPELALGACLESVGRGADIVVAYCDEPVDDGPPPDDLGPRFHIAYKLCARFDVLLVDWIACDGHRYRSSRLTLWPEVDWAALP